MWCIPYGFVVSNELVISVKFHLSALEISVVYTIQEQTHSRTDLILNMKLHFLGMGIKVENCVCLIFYT